jgi:hypothetical protein
VRISRSADLWQYRRGSSAVETWTETITKELVELEKKAEAEWKAKDDANRRRARQEYQDQQHKDEQNGVDRLKVIFNNNNATLASVFKKDCHGLDRAAKVTGL